MQVLERGEVVQRIIRMPSKSELLESVGCSKVMSGGQVSVPVEEQKSASIPRPVFSNQVVALSSSPVPNRKLNSKTRYPLFGTKIPGLSLLEKVPRLHRSNAFSGYSRELSITNDNTQDGNDMAVVESEDIADLEEDDENEIIPSSQISELMSFSQFEAGIKNLSSEALCTQLVSENNLDEESDEESDEEPTDATNSEKLAAGEVISEKAMKVELEVTCDDPTKVFDIMKGEFVKKARSRLPARNGFGESLGRFLFETKDCISPPLQVVIEGMMPWCKFTQIYLSFDSGPVGSGKSSLLYALCGLLRGEGKPVFIYDEMMEDCQSQDGDIDITELANRLPKYVIFLSGPFQYFDCIF